MQDNTKNELRILMILTGGTIGTVSDPDGKRRITSAGEEAEPMLLTALRKEVPDYTLKVTVRIPYQVLSEHMKTGHFMALAECLRKEELTGYDGVFITHGSDTLAFTAAFLGGLLKNCPVPVFLLAAQRPIEDPESNGVANAAAAVRLLAEGTFSARGNVIVPYRNSDDVMYLHRASGLRQCQPGTDDFFSADMRPMDRAAGMEQKEPAEFPETGKKESPERETTERDVPIVPEIRISPDVLLIHPYVGIRYDCISLEGIRGVLHTLYHSSTAPKELVGFLDRCREADVPCYILPCDPEDYHYETTAELLQHGAIPVSGMTEETAYIRLLMYHKI